jgi:ATP-dependent RNA helicase MSS116
MTEHKFSDLPISIESRRALSEIFKYEHMTSVQCETLPLILESDSSDCLAKAKTGTGKTLAFMIPTVEKIMKRRRDGRGGAANGNNHGGGNTNYDVNCLVISPTRELAQQISTETEKLLTYHDSRMRKVVTCVGGTNKNRDVKALGGITPIVVATPGRLLDHLQNSDLAKRMAKLDCLILDEADQLLDMGFRPDVERILRLLSSSKQTRQTLLFSATIPDQVNEIANLALRPNWNFVDTVGEDTEQTHMHVQQQLMITTQDRLVHDLFCILDRETSSTVDGGYKIIVFFTTARLTGFMAEMFNSVSSETGYNVLEIHSRKAQNARERASEQFRKSNNAVMFSSDVSARGMDYPDVTFVLQVGLTDRSQCELLGSKSRPLVSSLIFLFFVTTTTTTFLDAALEDV